MQLQAARQVHLDFHTSEHIPSVGADFDAAAFAQTVAESAVNSVTVFARCHHGWLYYDSKRFPTLVHPQLARKDLLTEQVDALHAVGVRAPVYITVQWDYASAATRPEWLIRLPDGAHEGPAFTEPGFYQSLCVNTGYADFLMAQTEEVCVLLGEKLDGLFFDITGIRPCLCASCRTEMRERGIDAADETAVRAFARFVMRRFKDKMSALVRAYKPDATIFYNAGHIGPCTRSDAASYSHFELESLPSGSWGYQHFPVTARYARTLGMDCMGMTGKFHTEWGDFHSLKNQAALEFECFRMMSYGFACSIGDQLEPNGRLNPATWALIGNVYRMVEAREAWSRPSVAVSEAAVLTSEPASYDYKIPDDVFGAAQLLEELGVQFDIIDSEATLDGYKLVYIPDSFRADEAFARKLDAYAAAGGAVIACGRGGLCGGSYPACFGARFEGDNDCFPDFIIAEGALAADLAPQNEYVIYEQGIRLSPGAGAETLLQARAPYFRRERDKFCSHRYTPSAKAEAYPAACRSGNVIVFAHPLFRQYRQNAPLWCKRLIANATDLLLPSRLVRHDGPSTLSVQLLRQPAQNRYTLHLLSYIPVRKSAQIDIIEERTPAYAVNVTLSLPEAIRAARLVPEDVPLAVKNSKLTVPKIDGYAIIELTV